MFNTKMKSIEKMNAEHSRLYKAMGAEGMKVGIDFSSGQRRNATKGVKKEAMNGTIPSITGHEN